MGSDDNNVLKVNILKELSAAEAVGATISCFIFLMSIYGMVTFPIHSQEVAAGMGGVHNCTIVERKVYNGLFVNNLITLHFERDGDYYEQTFPIPLAEQDLNIDDLRPGNTVDCYGSREKIVVWKRYTVDGFVVFWMVYGVIYFSLLGIAILLFCCICCGAGLSVLFGKSRA